LRVAGDGEKSEAQQQRHQQRLHANSPARMDEPALRDAIAGAA
jgi:hypothetical protein